jgi:hypothetical protein
MAARMSSVAATLALRVSGAWPSSRNLDPLTTAVEHTVCKSVGEAPPLAAAVLPQNLVFVTAASAS